MSVAVKTINTRTQHHRRRHEQSRTTAALRVKAIFRGRRCRPREQLQHLSGCSLLLSLGSHAPLTPPELNDCSSMKCFHSACPLKGRDKKAGRSAAQPFLGLHLHQSHVRVIRLVVYVCTNFRIVRHSHPHVEVY